MHRGHAWLSLTVFIVLLAFVAGKDKMNKFKNSGNANSAYWGSSSSSMRTRTTTSGVRTRTYSSLSVRNYNSGSRYYIQRSTITTSRSTFGYSYSNYEAGGYYYSGYGYRLYYSPASYQPIYVGQAYYYYPPMFIYYHAAASRYWNGNKPSFLCRNDNAFWPLENQTSEFVDQRRPAVNNAVFDLDLPESPEEDARDGLFSPQLERILGTALTELNSLEINEDLAYPDPENTTDVDWVFNATSRPPEPVPATMFSSVTASSATSMVSVAPQPPPSSMNKRRILAYNYFACPDGKDPEETYCCGSSAVQYCCTYNDFVYSQSNVWGFAIAMTVAAAFILCLVMSIGYKARRHCRKLQARRHHSACAAHSDTTLTTQTVEYTAAPQHEVRINVQPATGPPLPARMPYPLAASAYSAMSYPVAGPPATITLPIYPSTGTSPNLAIPYPIGAPRS